jgi:SAM-dependent methyltransferase
LESLKVTVDLDTPTDYRPSSGDLNSGVPLRLRLGYRMYRRLVNRFTRKDGENFSVLEVGCGPGYLLHLLERWYPNCCLFGVDYDDRLLKFARLKAPSAYPIRANAEQMPWGKNSFDVVIALHLVEHLYHPVRFLEQVSDVLQVEGILIIATPNPSGLGAQIMKKDWEGWRHDHISLRPPRKWRGMLEQLGFEQLYSGTTLLSGVPLFRKLPFCLLNYVPLLLFGTFPWHRGEAFIGVFRRLGGRASRAPVAESQKIVADPKAPAGKVV